MRRVCAKRLPRTGAGKVVHPLVVVRGGLQLTAVVGGCALPPYGEADDK